MPWVWVFSPLPSGSSSPSTEVSTCGDPAEPCKRCRNVLVCVSLRPGEGSVWAGQLPGAPAPAQSPPAGAEGAWSPGGGVQLIWGQIFPKSEPWCHQSVRA